MISRVLLVTEKEVEVKATTDSLKSERVKRREAETKLSSLEDEIVELKETVSSLNKVGDCTLVNSGRFGVNFYLRLPAREVCLQSKWSKYILGHIINYNINLYISEYNIGLPKY